MVFARRMWCPALGAAAAVVLPPAYERSRRRWSAVRCDGSQNLIMAGVGIGGIALGMLAVPKIGEMRRSQNPSFVHHYQMHHEDAAAIIKAFPKGQGVGNLEARWVELVAWCNKRQGNAGQGNRKPRDCKLAIADVKSAFGQGQDQAAHPEPKWFGPLRVLVRNPRQCERLDLDGDGQLEFHEFAYLYLLIVTTQSAKDGGMSRTDLLKTLFQLMDLDGDGHASSDEFIRSMALLSSFSIVRLEMLEKFSHARMTRRENKSDKRKEMQVVGNARIKSRLHDLFKFAYTHYDHDKDEQLTLEEWLVFAAEWLDWNVLDPKV